MRAIEQTDGRMAQYLHLDSCLLQTTVQRPQGAAIIAFTRAFTSASVSAPIIGGLGSRMGVMRGTDNDTDVIFGALTDAWTMKGIPSVSCKCSFSYKDGCLDSKGMPYVHAHCPNSDVDVPFTDVSEAEQMTHGASRNC